jgi:hypothetical protein
VIGKLVTMTIGDSPPAVGRIKADLRHKFT